MNDMEDLVLIEHENDALRPDDGAAAGGRRSRDVSYGEGRYKQSRRMYPWKARSVGRQALCHLYRYAMGFGTDEDFVRARPSKLGLDGDGALEYLREHCPEVFDEYSAATGNPLTSAVVMGRIGNMWRSNAAKTFALGPEHPRVHAALRPVLDTMFAADATL